MQVRYQMDLYQEEDDSDQIDLSEGRSQQSKMDANQDAMKEEYIPDQYKDYIIESGGDGPVHIKDLPNFNSCAPNYFHNNFYLANDELPPERSSLKFPASREIYQYVEDKEKLNELLELELRMNNLFIDLKIHETKNKCIRDILVVCHSCGHKLLMKYGINRFRHQTHYKLIHFDNTHLHQNQKSLLVSKDFKHRLFQKEFQNHDKNITMQEFYKSLQKKYDITYKEFRQFYYAMNEKKHQEMRTLLNFLKDYNSRIWMCTQFSIYDLLELNQFDSNSDYTKDPDFMMMSLNYMYQNCKLFSRICHICIVPGFISNKNKFGAKNWTIIAFSGLNHFNDLVPYAFVFLQAKALTIEAFSGIVNKFMKQFEVKPEIIITPYDQFYLDMISKIREDIKFTGLHLYDGICYIQTIGEQIDNICDRMYYQNIILSKTKYQFMENCRILQQKVKPTKKNMDAFNKLIELSPKMCFTMIETHQFIGLIFRYSANKYIFNFIRQVFTKRTIMRYHQNQDGSFRKQQQKNEQTFIKSIFMIIRAALRYSKDTNQGMGLRGGYCQWRSQNYLDMPEIENIRINIKTRYLELIMEQYGKIFEMEVAERDLKDPQLTEMKTFDVYDKKLRSIFVVSPAPIFTATQQFGKCIWRCNCCYSLKIGLPCGHQIKVAVTTGTSLMDQIHQLWLKKRVYGQNLKRRGRTKGTRRNTEK